MCNGGVKVKVKVKGAIVGGADISLGWPMEGRDTVGLISVHGEENPEPKRACWAGWLLGWLLGSKGKKMPNSCPPIN